MKPCPFCGKEVDMEEPDTLYPSGVGWAYSERSGLRHFVSFRDVPKEQWCYSMNCPETTRGCGAEMVGNSKQEAIDKWNRRVQ
jgi:hypothetical protein